MKKAVADIWVKALRSGEYKQGTKRLRGVRGDTREQFCCLGVLCNLHAQAHPEYAKKQKYKGTYGNGTELPPKVVLEWAGLGSEIGYIDELDESLAELNDTGASFSEIADIIQKNWRKL